MRPVFENSLHMMDGHIPRSNSALIVPICTHEAEWTPFQTHCYSENLVAPGIEPGTSLSAARNSDHDTKEAVTNIIYI
jgi:hypothetical protein